MLIHIGTPKAGSSAIQAAIGGESDVWLMALCAHGRSRNDLLRRWKRTDWDTAREEARARLRDVSTSPALSTEFLWDRTTPEQVESFHREVSPVLGDVRLVAYLRDPVKHFTSLVSQRIKAGQHNWSTILTPPSYDYDETISVWRKWFDLETYDYEEIDDVARHFCGLAGVEYHEQPRANRSLSKAALELLVKINRCADRAKEDERRSLVRALEEMEIPGEPFQLPAEIVAKLRKDA